MSDPKFGIVFRKIEEEPRPVIGADLSTIGLIGPADDADADEFPLDTPVKVYSNDTAKIALIGSAGYLQDALNGINNQLGELQVAAQCVIVRTATGNNNDPALRAQQTIAKIMGSSIAGTGVWAFLKSPELLACTPRLIMAPGYTGQLANNLGTLTVDTVGVGYTPDETYDIDFSGGGTSPSITLPVATIKADANGELHSTGITVSSYGAWFSEAPTATVDAPPAGVRALATCSILDGGVDSLTIQTEGEGYIPGNTYAITFAGGGGEVQATAHAVANSEGKITQNQVVLDTHGSGYETTPTATVDDVPTHIQCTLIATMVAGANPIITALPAILDQILAHAIVESAGTSETDDEDWREKIGSSRIFGISGGVKILDPDSSLVVTRPLAPRVAGIVVRRDHETGAPFHSPANQPVNGIVGPQRTIMFSLTDGANEGQQLLTNQIGIVVRGETGSDFAIASGGFVFVGFENCGSDQLWSMFSVMRGRDYIHLSLLKVLRWYLGKFNITGHTVMAIMNTMKGFLRDLQALDHILGFKVDFKGSYNSAEEIRLGHLTIGFAAEEPPVLTRITNLSARYRPAIDMMVQQLERQLNVTA